MPNASSLVKKAILKQITKIENTIPNTTDLATKTSFNPKLT